MNKANTNSEKERERDKDGIVTIDFETFLDIMTSKLFEKENEIELEKSFSVFSSGKNIIEYKDLQRLAKELGENMSEDELKEMMYEANRNDREGTVNISQFVNLLSTQNNK